MAQPGNLNEEHGHRDLLAKTRNLPESCFQACWAKQLGQVKGFRFVQRIEFRSTTSSTLNDRPRWTTKSRTVWAATLMALSTIVSLNCRSYTQTPISSKRLPIQRDAWPTRWTTISGICKDRTPRDWVIRQGQQTMGYSRGACLGQDKNGWHLLSQLSQDQNFSRVEYEFHLWLNENQLPVRAQLNTPSSRSEYTWTESGLQETQGETFKPIAESSNTTWILPGHAVFLRESMFRMGLNYQSENQQAVHRVYVPEYETIVSHTFGFSEDVQSESSMQATASAGRFIFVESQQNDSGLKLDRGLGPEGNEIYRQVQLSQPLRIHFGDEPNLKYKGGEDLIITQVTIPANRKGPKLAGELVQAKLHSKSAKTAALMFLSDSGSQNRYGFVQNTRIDMGSHEIHDAIARAGVIVLRTDDRGTGASEHGSFLNPGFLEIVEDDRRALRWLAQQPMIDPRRIFLVGHGEGAIRALLLAQDSIVVGGRRHKLAGLILMAAPGRNMQAIALDQIAHSLRGQSPQQIEQALNVARQEYQAALKDDDLSAKNEGQRRWTKELFSIEPLELIRNTKIPLLAVQGGKDFQIDAEKDFAPIVDQIKKRSRKDQSHQFYSQLDHLFKPEPGESSVNHYADANRHVDSEFVRDLIRWLQDRR